MTVCGVFALDAWMADLAPNEPTGTPNNAALGTQHVLILVSANSPAGLDIVREYRSRYPEITDDQVVYLTGLVDFASAWASPSDEILFRSDSENLVAHRGRQALETRSGFLDRVYCIITTAGMPHRIEDTNPELGSVVKPAGSSANQVLVKLPDARKSECPLIGDGLFSGGRCWDTRSVLRHGSSIMPMTL